MIDVWFARHDDLLWVTFVPAGGSPSDNHPVGLDSVKDAMSYIKDNGTKVRQYGICSPETLGLE